MPEEVSRRAAVVAALTAVALGALALDRGSYDIVSRQELAILVWAVVGAGWTSGLLPRATMPRALRVAVAGLALLCVVCAASLGWTESAERTLSDLTRDSLYLGVLILAGSAIDRRSAPWAVLGCLLACVIVMSIGMVSRLSPSAFPANDVGRIFETPRLSYPLNYWNALGAYAAMAMALALAFSGHARSHAIRFAALAMMPLGAGIIFLTYSRAALVGLAVAAAVVLVVARHRVTAAVQCLSATGLAVAFVVVMREHREIADAKGVAGAGVVLAVLVVATGAAGLVALATRRLDGVSVPRRIGRPAAIVVAVAVLIAAGVAGPDIASDAWSQFSRASTTDTTDPLARLGTLSGSRYEIFDAGLSAFAAHPVTGTGSGTFEFWFNRTGGGPQLRDGHSLLLEPMAEMGLLGLLATLVLLGGLGVAAASAWRRARGGLEVAATVGGLAVLAVWVAQGSVDWIWECPAVTILALVAVGAAAMVAGQDGAHRPCTASRAFVGLLAVVIVALQLPGISSTRHLRASERAGSTGNVALARAEAQSAVDAQPWSAVAWGQLAVTDDAANRRELAVARFGRAQELEPTNWRWPYLRARALARLGRPDAALVALRRARELRPASPFLNSATQ